MPLLDLISDMPTADIYTLHDRSCAGALRLANTLPSKIDTSEIKFIVSRVYLRLSVRISVVDNPADALQQG